MRRLRAFISVVLIGIAFGAPISCGDDDSPSSSDDDPGGTSDDGDNDNSSGDVTSDDDSGAPNCQSENETRMSTHASPRFLPEYYAEQSSMYFDTLDSDADPLSVPNYSTLVARWEWPPWLKLTGFGSESMIWIDRLLRLYPTSVSERDCRAFDRQPFGRCRVVFYYNGDDPCPIYEEFTFNDQGQITFIEAWSDLPGYLPSDDPDDRWAEDTRVRRLSTKIPGLGSRSGMIDPGGYCMQRAADRDGDIADFVMRAGNPVFWWVREFTANPNSFSTGCGW
jgi:hypothetical protein